MRKVSDRAKRKGSGQRRSVALLCLLLPACAASTTDPIDFGATEIVWGERRVFGAEIPVGQYALGGGIWFKRKIVNAGVAVTDRMLPQAIDAEEEVEK